MSTQGNENNHNHKGFSEDDSFLNFGGVDSSRITGVSAEELKNHDEAENEERATKLKEAIEKENSSAYDDLDDFVYRQNKRRTRTSGRRHHHRHRSPSMLSPGHKGSKIKKKHRHKHHFHKHHHRKRMKRWQKVCIGFLLVILALLVSAASIIVIMINMGKGSLVDKTGMNINPPDSAEVVDNGNYIYYKGNKYKYNENITSILCMGIDKDTLNDVGGDIGTGGDADSIFVITLDLSNGKTKLLNISRDTMTDIAIYSPSGSYVGDKKAQLALAYAYGDGRDTSCHNVLVSVRELLYNVPINSYLSLNTEGIGAINDAIGGVTVVSPETIGKFKKGETYTLMGSMAQLFVISRSHATPKGNSLRMERQRAYLESFGSTLKTKTKSDLMTPIRIFNEASPYICTNIDANKVSFLAYNALRGNYKGFDIVNIPGKVKAGKKYAEFYIDEKKCLELFLDVDYKNEGKIQ